MRVCVCVCMCEGRDKREARAGKKRAARVVSKNNKEAQEGVHRGETPSIVLCGGGGGRTVCGG